MVRRGCAHLVLRVELGQLDRLSEDAIRVLVQLDCFPPVIKGAGHVDIGGSVFPGRVLGGSWWAGGGMRREGEQTNQTKVYLPMSAQRCRQLWNCECGSQEAALSGAQSGWAVLEEAGAG